MKRCTKCGEEKPLDAYYVKDGRWRSGRCKPCVRLEEKARLLNADARSKRRNGQRQRRTEQVSERRKAEKRYRDIPLVKARLRDQSAERRKANPDHYADISKRTYKRASAELADRYVKALLVRDLCGNTREIVRESLPHALISAKREQLRIHRHLKKEKP